MKLLNQFIFETGPSVYEGERADHEIMSAALSSPYTMYQMLALSALHLSHTRTAQSSQYREAATFLQTEALSLFKDSWAAEITAESCVPILLFSSLLTEGHPFGVPAHHEQTCRYLSASRPVARSRSAGGASDEDVQDEAWSRPSLDADKHGQPGVDVLGPEPMGRS